MLRIGGESENGSDVFLKILLICLAVLIGIPLLTAAFLLIFSAPVNRKKEYESESAFYRFMLNMCVFIAMKAFCVKPEVKGLEKLPEGSPVLFVGNHRSGFDPIVTMYVMRKYKIVYISKPEVFGYPALGKIMHRCRCMAIDRENPRNAMKTICRAAELLGEGDVSVGVYPEGTRSKNGEILPFHNGVFKIAQKADVPIAVIALSGTDKIYKNPLRKNKVKLVAADVIPADDVRRMSTSEIGERVRGAIEAALSEAGE